MTSPNATLSPAAAVLAANIEADALNMVKDVYQGVNNIGSALTFNKLMTGRKVLNDAPAPMDGRTALLNTQDNVDLVDALKGLFQDSRCRQGTISRGFDGPHCRVRLLRKHFAGFADDRKRCIELYHQRRDSNRRIDHHYNGFVQDLQAG